MSYVLIDVSNGGALEPRTASKVYFWTFRTLKEARRFLKNQKRVKHAAELIGPFRTSSSKKLLRGGRYCLWARVEE